ncbi:hypothetical protein BDF20DRAFT_874668 [Mycotypha africana]|uniref:uncharacterized protein n=1 Tax=Mycotypha africana TaxID=64632 RepID=UPI0023015AAD|nr:uncharacterized protein BDF20DRAFT_874668 [Mycotypha africana]KAI8977418.1 hypothetical protein BDF20DRAFT_874668 [Mycotypha africana]
MNPGGRKEKSSTTHHGHLSSRDVTIVQPLESSCESKHKVCSTNTEQVACPSYGCSFTPLLMQQSSTTTATVDATRAAEINSSHPPRRIALIAGLTCGCVVLTLLLATIAGVVIYRRRKVKKILQQQAQDEKEAYIPEHPPIIISKIEHVLPPPLPPPPAPPAPPPPPAAAQKLSTTLPKSQFNGYCHQTLKDTDDFYHHPQSPFVIGAQSLQIPHLDTPDPSSDETYASFLLRRSLHLQPVTFMETSSYLSRASSVKVSNKYDHHYPSDTHHDTLLCHHAKAPSMASREKKRAVPQRTAVGSSRGVDPEQKHHRSPQATEALDIQDNKDEDASEWILRRAVSVRKNNSTHSHASSITRVGSVTSQEATKRLWVCAQPTFVRVESTSRKRTLRTVTTTPQDQSPPSPFHVTLHDPPPSKPAAATMRGMGPEGVAAVVTKEEDERQGSDIHFYVCPTSEDNDKVDDFVSERIEYNEDALSCHDDNSSTSTLADGEITVYWEQQPAMPPAVHPSFI